MIKFFNTDDNKQFISIQPKDGTDTNKIIAYIIDKHPTIEGNIYASDTEEILINLYDAADSHYDFSLNELRNTVSEISTSDIHIITVDMDEETQRVYN